MIPTLTETATTHPIRILVVDDKPAVIEGICRLVAKQPSVAVVASANNGQDAIEKLTDHKPDLVVMDVHMPEHDGRAALAGMRRRVPEIRIIMISIDEEERVRADCMQRGADSFLPKIGLHRTLLAEIKRLFPEHVS